MKNALIILFITLITACASQKSTTGSTPGRKSNKAFGDTRTLDVEYLDENTCKLSILSTDKSYGYSENNPIKVGQNESGPRNERRFLNGLLGPNGEPIAYTRVGSCCPFKTPNGLFDNSGMLDKYQLTWQGQMQPVTLYINLYDEGDLLIPVGLTAKK